MATLMKEWMDGRMGVEMDRLIKVMKNEWVCG